MHERLAPSYTCTSHKCRISNCATRIALGGNESNVTLAQTSITLSIKRSPCNADRFLLASLATKLINLPPFCKTAASWCPINKQGSCRFLVHLGYPMASSSSVIRYKTDRQTDKQNRERHTDT